MRTLACLALTFAAATASADPAFGVRVSGAGRPIVFIPGLACPGSVWDGTVAHLGGHYQSHVLTLAGFAGQPPLPAAALDAYLQTVHDEIAAYIRANHLDHPILVGHSLGGAIALWLGETEPDLGGVIVVDEPIDIPSAFGETPAGVKPFVDKQRAHFDAIAPAQMPAEMREFLGPMMSRKADRDRVVAAAAKSDPHTIAAAFAQLFAKNLKPDLAKLTAPLVIAAASDLGGVPPKQVAAVWQHQIAGIAHARAEVVPNTRHFVMLDQPDAFYALVDRALAQPPQ